MNYQGRPNVPQLIGNGGLSAAFPHPHPHVAPRPPRNAVDGAHYCPTDMYWLPYQ